MDMHVSFRGGEFGGLQCHCEQRFLPVGQGSNNRFLKFWVVLRLMMVRRFVDVCYDVVVCNTWHRRGGCLRTPDEEILKTHCVCAMVRWGSLYGGCNKVWCEVSRVMFVDLAEQASSLSERRRRHRMNENDRTVLRNELVYSNGIFKFFPPTRTRSLDPNQSSLDELAIANGLENRSVVASLGTDML